MGKRKAENELNNFVWKRNIKYDLQLLHEVELFNPFAFSSSKPIWIDIADALRDGVLKMKVTERSCRERVGELLKNHRKGELTSIRTSGVSGEEMSELETLLTNVSKLEEAKPDKKLKKLYSKQGRDEAEGERSKALESMVSDSDSEQDTEKTVESKVEPDESKNDKDFEFGPKHGRFQTTNPKKDLVTYLEKKNKGDVTLRKEELRIREKEMENKSKELEIMQETKSKEMEILRLKAEAEAEERKKFMDLLITFAKPRE